MKRTMGKPMSGGEIKQAVELRKQGLKLAAIARRLHRPLPTLWRHIREAGLTTSHAERASQAKGGNHAK
mgnify:CR=1 FL=1